MSNDTSSYENESTKNMNDPIPTARFTGIFIPSEIMEMDLNLSEMMLLSFIDALYCKKHGGCFASNAHLAQRLKLKENTIAVMIGKLKDLNLVELVSFNGRRRVIRACKENWFKKEGCQSKADFDCNQRQTLTTIKGSILPQSNPSLEHIHIETKEEHKEDTLSISHKQNDQNQTSADACVSFLYSKIKERDRRFILNKEKEKIWKREFIKMHQKDGRSWEDIENIMIYAQNDPFWSSRTLTPSNLRRHATTIVTQLKTPTIKDVAESTAKRKQSVIEKNSAMTTKLMKGIPVKYYTILADSIKIDYPGSCLRLDFDDKNFEYEIRSIITKIQREL